MSARRKESSEAENKENSAEEEDFEEVIREAASFSTTHRPKPGSSKQIILKIPEAVDDFLRNFLWRAGLWRTLGSFEAEWYSSGHKLLTQSLMMAATDIVFIPDAVTHKQLLQRALETVHRETELLRQEALVAGENMVRIQRERDFHKLQYQRVAEDKNRLMEDFKQLKKHLQSYEPALRQLEDKYQAALRQKMILSLQKGPVQNTPKATLKQDKSQIKTERSIVRSNSVKPPAKTTTSRHERDTEFPSNSRLVSSHSAHMDFEKLKSLGSFNLSCSIRAHELPISCIDLHPRQQILVSASDDCSWRLWALPADGEKVGQMVMTGEGHSDWLSACSFHPDGAKLATTSGDSVVRLWDLSLGCCVLKLAGHSQPTWGCSFHSCGHFLASCSADRTAKLWDLNSQRCCLTLRHHAASVNSVSFLPFSNLLLTASADKTLAMWDARLGVCTATFHGHQHPCNHAAFSLAGNIMASCDSHGIINLWDIRNPTLAMATANAGLLAANQVAFSPSGKTLAVASSDSLVRMVEVDSCVVSCLRGHSDGVQSVTFSQRGETVISAGSDGVINVWS